MKKTIVKDLDYGTFRGYVKFSDMLQPAGFRLVEEGREFFRDVIDLKIGLESFVSSSIFQGGRTDCKQILESIEHHSKCGEDLISLDGDCVVCLAKVTPPGAIPLEDIEAFYIPKGNMLSLNPGVWHNAPPERAYAKDCIVYQLTDKEKLEIVKSM